MLRKWTIITLIVIVVGSVAFAGSIYAKRNNNMKSLYADDTARSVGDILTITIAEDHKTDNKVSRDLSNETSRTSSFDGELGIETSNSSLLSSMPGFTMSSSGSRDLEGQSDYSDERSIEDSITVVVEDILENGNLVVIGTRKRDIAGDVQTISVSGIVRPSDISFLNTVDSEKVANFMLVTTNEGVTDKYNESGWLSNIFDALWPF